MPDLKKTIHAVLFASAQKLEMEKIAKICRASEEETLTELKNWQIELEESSNPMMLVNENNLWGLTIREKFISAVRKIVKKTDLPKSILETLSIVAYRSPVLQSEVIKVRTNKAYEHLAYLEKSGFLFREKSGRTKLIKLAPKFYEYFDISPEKLKEKLDEKIPLETYDAIKKVEIPKKELESYSDKLGDLEVFDKQSDSVFKDLPKDLSDSKNVFDKIVEGGLVKNLELLEESKSDDELDEVKKEIEKIRATEGLKNFKNSSGEILKEDSKPVSNNGSKKDLKNNSQNDSKDESRTGLDDLDGLDKVKESSESELNKEKNKEVFEKSGLDDDEELSKAKEAGKKTTIGTNGGLKKVSGVGLKTKSEKASKKDSEEVSEDSEAGVVSDEKGSDSGKFHKYKKSEFKESFKKPVSKGLYPEGLPPDVEKRVNKRVHEIVTGKKDSIDDAEDLDEFSESVESGEEVKNSSESKVSKE